MSSPDPLTDSTMAEMASLPPSSASRPVTRSQRSRRFLSLGSIPSSPQKNDVLSSGSTATRSSRKRRKDVAADDVSSSAQRKLFDSTPTPARRITARTTTTTTTVPLRNSVEEESDGNDPGATPRARGRTRQTNGTPIPGAGTKRRAPTPVRRTPRRARTEPTEPQEVQATPTPRRSTRTRKTPSSAEPSSEAANYTVSPRPSTARRGRRRRHALAPEEVRGLTQEVGDLRLATTQLPPVTSDDEVDLVRAPSESSDGRSESESVGEDQAADVATAPEPESDIWISTMADDQDATPRAAPSLSREPVTERSPSRESTDDLQGPELNTERETGDENGDEDAEGDIVETTQGGYDDYGYADFGGSDASSYNEPDADVGAPDNAPTGNFDTIAQGEDFSMIFMDSIPSMQQEFNNSAPPVAQDELGEETSLIINNTLQSLRKVAAQREIAARKTAALQSSPVVDVPSDAHPVAEEVEEEDDQVTPMRPSASNIRATTRWSQTPRRASDSSPLRHRALTYSARQAAESATRTTQPVQAQESSPIVNRSTEQQEEVVEEQEDSNVYEDSFSEIPEAVLTAATPRRQRVSQLYGDLEQDELQVEAAEPDSESSLFVQDEPQEIETPDELAMPTNDMDDEEQPEEISGDDEDLESGELSDAEVQAAQEAEEEVVEEAEEEEAEEENSDEEVDRGIVDELDDDDLPDELFEGAVAEAGADVLALGGRSSSARLPTPDNTPPEASNPATIEFVDQVKASRPASRLSIPSRSPRAAPSFVTLPQEEPEGDYRDNYEDEDMQYDQDDEGEDEAGVDAAENDGDVDDEVYDDEMLADQGMDLDDQDAEADDQLEEDLEADLEQEDDMAEASQPSVEATPPRQMTSPLQEPQSVQNDASQDKTVRPALSAIVRAGRVLQSITSDPPSPEEREDRQLRSPFRSSGSKESWNGSKDSQNDHRTSRSPLQQRGATTSRSPVAVDEVNAAQGSLLDVFRRSQRASAERNHLSPLRQSPASSMHITPPSDEAMSWVAKEGPISPSLRGDKSLQEVARTSSRQSLMPRSPVKPVQVEDVEEPDEQPAEEPAEITPEATPEPEQAEEEPARDDDTDIWELEAMRETPRSVRQQPFGKKIPGSNLRRGAIPSPWTKRSVQRPAVSRVMPQRVHDQSHITEEASVAQRSGSQGSEAEEYSQLAQRQELEAAKKNAQPESTNKASRFDLSSFFSSPAAIPSMLAQKLFPSRDAQPAVKEQPQPETTEVAPAVPTTSMFPQAPSQRPAPLFSPSKRRQALHQRPPQQSVSLEAEQDRSSSPNTPEQLARPTLAQKQNFTPRPRQSGQTFFQPSSTQPKGTTAAVTPPRTQLSRADIHRWQQEASNASEASSDFQRPLLRPLPPKNASPTKSSLRSPLKPHTPGRVVEFTSSVLSPAEQVNARIERQHSDSVLSQDPYTKPTAEDKENELSDPHDISMEDAPPLGQPTKPVRLSQTTWTRDHWLFLDLLIQMRRRAPFAHDYPRTADKFLGKTVKSHGEGMSLERWHLDCVDAFKDEVGGWDEDILAKRLFSLLLGEDRRRRTAMDKSAVMFH